MSWKPPLGGAGSQEMLGKMRLRKKKSFNSDECINVYLKHHIPLLISYTYLLISLHSPNPHLPVIVTDLQPFLACTCVSYVLQIIDSMTILCPCRVPIVWRALSVHTCRIHSIGWPLTTNPSSHLNYLQRCFLSRSELDTCWKGFQ